MIVWFAKSLRWTPDQVRRQSVRDLWLIIDAYG